MSSPYRVSDDQSVSLESETDGVRQTLTLTRTGLVFEWKAAGGLGRSEHALRDLSPDVAYYEGRSATDRQAMERGVLAIGAALVAYFSSAREHVPLLAPFLLLIGAYYLVEQLRARGRSAWTVIQHRDGRALATIDHRGCNRADLDRFVAALQHRATVARATGVPASESARDA